MSNRIIEVKKKKNERPECVDYLDIVDYGEEHIVTITLSCNLVENHEGEHQTTTYSNVSDRCELGEKEGSSKVTIKWSIE